MDELTAREIEVASLIAEGKSNHQIGKELGIELSTIKRHIRNIYQKLGYHDETGRTNRVRLALDFSKQKELVSAGN